jgi:type I restriction enzyme S subunit
VADVSSGGTPKTNEPSYWGGSIIWLTPSEVVANQGRRITGSERTLSQKGLRESGARLVPTDAVLVTSRATVGAVAIAGTELAVNQGFAALVAGEQIDPKYLYYWAVFTKPELERQATGSTFPEISRGKVRALSISYPPIAEQLRIAAVLEQADRAVEAAVRHVADAQALLRSTIEDGVTARDLPARWEIAALGEAAAVPSIKPKPFTGNRPYFATGAVDRERIGHPVEVSFERRPGRADCEPEINDFGFARMKGARKFIRTDDDIVTSLFSTGFSFWRAGDKAGPAYLHYVTRSEAFQQAKDSASSEGILGGATDRQIAKISILLPPLDEQQAIVARIEKVESAVRAAEAHLERLRALRSSLLENLVSGRVRLPEIETAGSKVAA